MPRNSSTRGSRALRELTFQVTSFTASAALPARGPLLAECPHALAQILGLEAGLSQLDELALDLGVEPALRRQDVADRALVAAHAERGVGGEVLRQVERGGLELRDTDDLVDESPAERRACVDVAGGEEQLARARGADGLQEAPQAGVRVDEAELGGRHAEQDAVRG